MTEGTEGYVVTFSKVLQCTASSSQPMLCCNLGATLPSSRQYQAPISTSYSGLSPRHCLAAAAGRQSGGSHCRAPAQQRPCLPGLCCSTASVAAANGPADPGDTYDGHPTTLPHLMFEEHARLTVAAQQAWYQVLSCKHIGKPCLLTVLPAANT